MGEQLVLPSPNVPLAPVIPRVILDIPTAEIPSYKQIVIPPSDLRPPEGVKSKEEEEQPEGIRQIQIPVLDFKIPVPENEILITAGTTAVVSVAAALTATAAFKWAVTAMKPIIKQAIGKIRRKKEGVNARV